MLVALHRHSANTLLCVNFNRTAANRLIETIVIHVGLNSEFVFCPNSDSERVRIAVSGPDLEFVFSGAVYCPCSFELGIYADRIGLRISVLF
jgi:hypothetical protein